MPATAHTALSRDCLYSLLATLYFRSLLDILSILAALLVKVSVNVYRVGQLLSSLQKSSSEHDEAGVETSRLYEENVTCQAAYSTLNHTASGPDISLTRLGWIYTSLLIDPFGNGDQRIVARKT